ncbi:hypothetical protein TM48_00470 [Mycobacterium shottsii]|nr:hypothetical protein TM48_00470 [Mycobacterium shottsii]
MGTHDRGNHRRPQPLRAHRVVEVVGDVPAHAVVLHRDSSAEHGRLPAEPFLRPDDQAVEFFGAAAHDRDHFHGVVLGDPSGSGRQVRTQAPVHDIGTMAQRRCSVEQRQHRVELSIGVQVRGPPRPASPSLALVDSKLISCVRFGQYVLPDAGTASSGIPEPSWGCPGCRRPRRPSRPTPTNRVNVRAGVDIWRPTTGSAGSLPLPRHALAGSRLAERGPRRRWSNLRSELSRIDDFVRCLVRAPYA